MVAIDFAGLILTIILSGPRYAHYVLTAVVIHISGQIIMSLFLHGHVESILTAGIFGYTVVSGLANQFQVVFIACSGSLANYIAASTVGGVEYEQTGTICNPFSRLKYPFAVVNLRVAVFSLLFTLWRLF